jgi:diacylglycerol kinase family enzyme
MNTLYFIYETDQRKKLNSLGDFEKKTPTPMGTTNAFSKILQIFQNSIPRELDQKLDIPRISTIH